MTENQRTSILPDDAPVGAEEATTPAEIKSILQLQWWAVHEPEQFLTMLNQSRYKRDRALESLQDFDRMTEIMEDTVYQADQAQTRLREAKKEVTTLKAELIPLRDDLEAKEERIIELEECLILADDRAQQIRDTTPALSASTALK